MRFYDEDDAALLPSVSLEPSPASIEPVSLQLGEPVAAAGVAEANRELVSDESAATTGADRRTAGEACAVLLAAAGGRTSESAEVQGDAGSDRAAAGTGRDRQMVVNSAPEICLPRLGQGEVWQK